MRTTAHSVLFSPPTSFPSQSFPHTCAPASPHPNRSRLHTYMPPLCTFLARFCPDPNHMSPACFRASLDAVCRLSLTRSDRRAKAARQQACPGASPTSCAAFPPSRGAFPRSSAAFPFSRGASPPFRAVPLFRVEERSPFSRRFPPVVN